MCPSHVETPSLAYTPLIIHIHTPPRNGRRGGDGDARVVSWEVCASDSAASVLSELGLDAAVQKLVLDAPSSSPSSPSSSSASLSCTLVGDARLVSNPAVAHDSVWAVRKRCAYGTCIRRPLPVAGDCRECEREFCPAHRQCEQHECAGLLQHRVALARANGERLMAQRCVTKKI